ncbi:MAG: response regulator [Ferrovibrio sp.]|uniref:response regulator n=1 Tax=Ferrovibrio sp. TaxID=1917215 RepID=UPI00260564F4|nr:response regulator [Ferrovibrio sp.]MCW0236522.1 response regulator [Ferrovibrio sp.]
MTFQPPKTRRIDPSAFRRATILVAEGDRGLRRTLRDVLLGMGFPSIIMAGNSAETMRQIIEQRPSVVLLDHKLPGASGGDGLTLTRRLRRDNDPLPIILMTASPDLGMVAAARDAGVNEIVRKPLSMEGLVLRLMHVLQVPRSFVRSIAYVGPDRRRLTDRRRTERRAEMPLPPELERRTGPSRRSGGERRKMKKG